MIVCPQSSPRLPSGHPSCPKELQILPTLDAVSVQQNTSHFSPYHLSSHPTLILIPVNGCMTVRGERRPFFGWKDVVIVVLSMSFLSILTAKMVNRTLLSISIGILVNFSVWLGEIENGIKTGEDSLEHVEIFKTAIK